jgi:Zn-dependent protease
MGDLSLVQLISIWILPLVFAITLHEVAHGWAAKVLGDRTAEKMGRLSLNPVHHIDPVGTLLVPGVLLLMGKLMGGGGFIFGWAKPVPVDFGKLRRPRLDMALVALAGPMANLLMAIFWALMVRAAHAIHFEFITVPLGLMGVAGIAINLVLMVLNLMPILPLDGGRIVAAMLPPRLSYSYAKLEPYGFIILLILIATHSLSFFLDAPLQFLQGLLFVLAGMR